MGRAIRWEDLEEGAFGGAAGTAAFTGLMWGARRAGLLGEMPPRKITRNVLEKTLEGKVPSSLVNATTTVTHLGFGVATGMLFGALSRRMKTRVPNVVLGAAFGGLLWVASYAGWAPALDLMPAPHRDRRDRPLINFLGHLLFGGILGALVRRK